LFYEMNLKDQTDEVKAIAQAAKSGNVTDILNQRFEQMKSQLEEKLKVLEGVLTPEQLATYRKEQMDMVNQQADSLKMALKMFPQKKTF
jgi:hypothetical protein